MTATQSRSARAGSSAAASVPGTAVRGTSVQGAAAAGRVQRKRTATHERVLITGVIAFGLAASVLGSMRVAGDVREKRAREAMAGSFVRVHERQQEFRRLNARFATFAELSSRGLRLAARQQVQRSTADASHWYLSLRDRNTGLICERTGELTDETGRERAPVCRQGTRRAVASGEGVGGDVEHRSAPAMIVAGGLGGR
jgi:uncharacterized protein HemX